MDVQCASSTSVTVRQEVCKRARSHGCLHDQGLAQVVIDGAWEIAMRRYPDGLADVEVHPRVRGTSVSGVAAVVTGA